MHTLTQQEVITRLCKLTAEVAEKNFAWKHAADCFCNVGEDEYYRFEEEVMVFIEVAVRDRLSDIPATNTHPAH